MRLVMILLAAGMVCLPAFGGDWPTVRHDAARTGYTPDALGAPLRLRWRCEFPNAPFATCVEPIVAGDLVYVGSLNGTVYAVSCNAGETVWTFPTGGPILHSPAFADGKLYVGSTDGGLYCLNAADGELRWRFDAGVGGFAASPAVVDGVVYIGSRGGRFFAIRDAGDSPQELWSFPVGAPVWQTTAEAGGKVYFMGEDMIARCLDASSGREVWKSRQVTGYRARDYYPCIAGDWVIFRTSPAIGAESLPDRANKLLAFLAGATDRIDAPLAAKLYELNQGQVPRGLIDAEAEAVNGMLDANPAHRTFYVFAAGDGAEVKAPVLWLGGCGGVGTPPALDAAGNVYTLWRSLYSGWLTKEFWDYNGPSSHNGIGMIDPASGKMTRLPPDFAGNRPWGFFCCIADEHSILQVAGDVLYMVHQGEITSMDLKTHRPGVLFQGRDKWLGQPSLPWSGNEWHGPARGGLAICNGRAYWLVGGYLAALDDGK